MAVTFKNIRSHVLPYFVNLVYAGKFSYVTSTSPVTFSSTNYLTKIFNKILARDFKAMSG